LAIVNSTNKTQTINFDREYEKVNSRQNSEINNGWKINSLTLEAEDGTILLRPIEEIKKAVFTNGSFARIFNQNGDKTRSGFFTYNQMYKGGLKIAQTDIDGDEIEETVVADKNNIKIFDNYGVLITQIIPFGNTFNGGLSISLADLDHDNKLEIITGP
jgi:hypothetical protein